MGEEEGGEGRRVESVSLFALYVSSVADFAKGALGAVCGHSFRGRFFRKLPICRCMSIGTSKDVDGPIRGPIHKLRFSGTLLGRPLGCQT